MTDDNTVEPEDPLCWLNRFCSGATEGSQRDRKACWLEGCSSGAIEIDSKSKSTGGNWPNQAVDRESCVAVYTRGRIPLNCKSNPYLAEPPSQLQIPGATNIHPQNTRY